MVTIGITGHRDLLNPDYVTRNIEYSLKYFKNLHKNVTAVSSVAKGADMVFAQEAVSQEIPLKIILPFHPEEYKKDFKGADLSNLETLLAANPFTIAGELSVNNAEERNNAYLKAGQLLVNECDIIIAVWDGKPAAGKGGTANIVEYTRAMNKELHIIKAARPDNTTIQPDEIQEVFEKLDKEAVKYKKKKFEPAWVMGIAAGLIAVFSFAIGQSFELSHDVDFLFTNLEFIFLFISFISLVFFAKKWKSAFLQKRRDAEYLRSVLWYRDAGIPIPPAPDIKHKPGPEVLALERKIATGITKIQNLHNAKRLAWSLAQQQVEYHQNTRIVPFDSRLHNLEMWLKVLKVVFFIATPINFILEVLKHYEVYYSENVEIISPYMLFVSLIIPPLYTAIEGIKYFSEWKRDIAVSQKTVDELDKSKTEIISCQDETSLLAGTKRLRDILEQENNEWTIRFLEKEVGAKV